MYWKNKYIMFEAQTTTYLWNLQSLIDIGHHRNKSLVWLIVKLTAKLCVYPIFERRWLHKFALTECSICHFNSLRPSDAYMRR